MIHDAMSAVLRSGRTYLPPVRADHLPTSSAEWRRRSGLTDPVVLAATVARRSGGFTREPVYADFFRTP